MKDEHPCLCDLPRSERVAPTEELVVLAEAPVSANEAAAAGFSVRTDVRSANYGNAPGHPQQMVAKPEGIMLHHTAGSKNGDLATLTREGTWVSSNDYVTKEPQIFELVPHPRRAWHAGTADAGTGYRPDGNTYYWGMEIENLGNGRDPYPRAQIDAIVWRCRQLRRRWPHINKPSQLFRHRDYAPSRKTDPSDNFPFAEVRKRVFAASDPTDPPGSNPAPTKPPTGTLHRVEVPAQQQGAYEDKARASRVVGELRELKVAASVVAEGGLHKVRVPAQRQGSYRDKANADGVVRDLKALGVRAAIAGAASPAPTKPAPKPAPPKNPLDELVEEAIAFGMELLGTPYGTGWEEGTWPDLHPLYARITRSDPASYYRKYPVICSGFINVERYEIAGLGSVGKAQGDGWPGGTAAIGRHLAFAAGSKPYPPVANTPRGWLVFSPYLGPELALQGHVGIALGNGLVLEARVPFLSANRTEDQGCKALIAGGGKPYTRIIPPEIWLRK